MTRTLPRENSDERQFIQYRGPQTSVSVDEVGVRFTTSTDDGRVVHDPLPVVDTDTDPDDAPADAVVRPLAEELVEKVPMVCWGVACEHATADGVCGKVFATPAAVAGHKQTHRDDDDD